MKNKDYRLYILMRNDLDSLSPGRAAAQASHASNAFIHKFGPGARLHDNSVDEWQNQTNQGFGTTIVLSASLDQINVILKSKKLCQKFIVGCVIDPDYAIKVTHEIADLLHQNYDAKWCNFKFDYNWSMDENDKSVKIIRKEVTCAYIFGTKEDLQPFLGELPLY
jgi:peptidyl-tRNA hydrolase